MFRAQGITQDQSLRTDVSLDNLDAQYIREPGVTYLFPDADPNFPTGQPGLAFNRMVADAGGRR